MAKHKVTFLPADVTIEVDDAKYPLADHGQPGSLLDIALANDIHLEHKLRLSVRVERADDRRAGR